MKAGCGRQLPAESWHAQDLHLHNLASLTTGLTFSRSAFKMIILDGIGEDVADDARKSLALQSISTFGNVDLHAVIASCSLAGVDTNRNLSSPT